MQARALPLVALLVGCGPRLAIGFEDTSADTSEDVGETETETATDSETGIDPIAPTMPAQLVAGGSHVCGLWSGLGVYCWGGGWLGQLGNGGFDNASTPQPVIGLGSGVSRLGVGEFHGCAALDGGEAVCWGHDISGSLGNGGSGDATQPVFVLGLTGPVLDVGGGPAQHHSCALMADGTMMCWGDNSQGQLGDGTLEPANTARPVLELSEVVDFAIGYIHTCAVVASGQVYCWGWNPHGLVDASQPTEALFELPWPKLGLDDAVAISGGNHHACVLHEHGGVSCWGYEGQGQLGDGSELEHGEPLPVAGLDDALAISGGTTHECALRTDGAIVCWGSNYHGQLGDGTTDSSPVPVAVVGIDDATQVTVGDGFGCALSDSRGALCWGDNNYGQLGDGSNEDSLVPVAVLPP